MTIEPWIVYIFAIGVLILFGFVKWRMSDLEGEITLLKDKLDKKDTQVDELFKRIHSLEQRSEQSEGRCQVVTSGLSERLGTAEKAIESLKYSCVQAGEVLGVEAAKNDSRAVTEPNRGVSEGEFRKNNEEADNSGDTDGDEEFECVKSGVEFWDKMAPLAETFDEPKKIANLGVDEIQGLTVESCSEPDEIIYQAPTYRWIFPKSDKDLGGDRVNGQFYFVVGMISKGERYEQELDSCNAIWNGYRFVPSCDKDWYFDEVYAFIKTPEANDVLDIVLEKFLKNKD